MLKICGPKLSLCFLIISVWGIIQLVLMGGFFYIKAVALAEDLPINHESIHDINKFFTEVDKAYTNNAYNCWIAAAMYLVTFLFSGYQFWLNSRMSL